MLFTILLVLALTAVFGWQHYQSDITKAYLLCAPTTAYYIRFPPGFRAYLHLKHGYPLPFEPGDYYGRVRKNLYGDPPAGRLLYELICAFLTRDVGMIVSPLDQCMFVKALIVAGTRMVGIVLLYVDDVLVVGDEPLVSDIHRAIGERFPLTDGGDDYLSLRINHDMHEGTLTVDQTHNIDALLESTHMTDCASTRTPLPTDFTAMTDEATTTAPTVELDMPSVLGSVGFITATRPDLMYAHGVLATAMMPSSALPTAPTATHRRALTRLLRYLKGTRTRGLTFRRSAGLDMFAHVDANFAQELHRTGDGAAGSRSSYIVQLAGAAIAARAPRQGPVALSTAEAEIYALCAVVRILLVLRSMVSFITGETLPPTIVHEDNTSVIDMVARRSLSARTRHLRVNLAFVIDAVAAADIVLVYTPTAIQFADIGTAQRAPDIYEAHRDNIPG